MYTNNWKSTQTPTLKCGNKSDGLTDKKAQERDLYTGPSATVNGTKGSNGTIITGNNALPVPVGLITSDEVVYAGGFGGKVNNGYWLYTNQYYWTMSPYNFDSSTASVFLVYPNGHLTNTPVHNASFGIRPVINLKSTVRITTNGEGDPGTPTNPYIVETE